MGQREAGVNAGPGGHGSELPASSRAAARQLDGEIAALREELSSLVGELDRRRHEALDVKLQLRRHAREMIVSGGALVAAVSGLVWLMSGRHRSMVSPKVSLVGKVVEGLSRIPRRTARAAAEPHASTKIVTVAAPAEVTNAAVAITVKKLLQLGLQRWWERSGRRGPLPLHPRAFKRLPAAMKHSDSGDRA